MNLVKIERLVTELLATGQITQDTRDDLYRILAEAKSNQVGADDLQYLQALHARIIPPNRSSEYSAGKYDGTYRYRSSESSSDQKKPDDFEAQLLRLREQLEKANRTIAELKSMSHPQDLSSGKFREIKKRFARRYHPDNVNSSSLETTIRTEIFKEFWAEFEDVERS